MNHLRPHRSAVHLLLLAACVFWAGCKGSDVAQNFTAEERFNLGKQKFDEGDYLEAISHFEIVKLQYPGSAQADDAQYYLGECQFQQESYLVSIEEYRALKRNYPTSPFVPAAQYKIGLCYFNLTPRFQLDQSYADKAIDEFQSFLEYYPTHELVPDAEARIQELNTRLARKLFDTAELYMKMDYYKPATIYYASVIEKYHDTPFAEPALLGKVKSLIARKKYDDAKIDIERFLQKYPTSGAHDEALSLQRLINEHLQDRSAALRPSQEQRPSSPR
jgi:outer membrane protein assembly factor BamD